MKRGKGGVFELEGGDDSIPGTKLKMKIRFVTCLSTEKTLQFKFPILLFAKKKKKKQAPSMLK